MLLLWHVGITWAAGWLANAHRGTRSPASQRVRYAREGPHRRAGRKPDYPVDAGVRVGALAAGADRLQMADRWIDVTGLDRQASGYLHLRRLLQQREDLRSLPPFLGHLTGSSAVAAEGKDGPLFAGRWLAHPPGARSDVGRPAGPALAVLGRWLPRGKHRGLGCSDRG